MDICTCFMGRFMPPMGRKSPGVIAGRRPSGAPGGGGVVVGGESESGAADVTDSGCASAEITGGGASSSDASGGESDGSAAAGATVSVARVRTGAGRETIVFI